MARSAESWEKKTSDQDRWDSHSHAISFGPLFLIRGYFNCSTSHMIGWIKYLWGCYWSKENWHLWQLSSAEPAWKWDSQQSWREAFFNFLLACIRSKLSGDVKYLWKYLWSVLLRNNARFQVWLRSLKALINRTLSTEMGEGVGKQEQGVYRKVQH